MKFSATVFDWLKIEMIPRDPRILSAIGKKLEAVRYEQEQALLLRTWQARGENFSAEIETIAGVAGQPVGYRLHIRTATAPDPRLT